MQKVKSVRLPEPVQMALWKSPERIFLCLRTKESQILYIFGVCAPSPSAESRKLGKTVDYSRKDDMFWALEYSQSLDARTYESRGPSNSLEELTRQAALSPEKVARTWLRQQHQDLIPGPVALTADDKNVEWESGIQRMYTDFPIPWALGNFASPADRCKRATQFLIHQTRKVHSDIAVETKRAAKATQAAAARAKRRGVPAAPATSTARTTTIARTTTRTRRSPVAIRSPVAARGSLDPSSSLAMRRALTTRKRARIDDVGEVAESLVNEFPRLVLWVHKRALQLRMRSMVLRTNITLRNEEYLVIFPVEQGGRVQFFILDQGSWNVALMMAQGKRPNEGSFVCLMVVAIAAQGDMDHGAEDEIRPDYPGEDEDEEELGRGNRCGNPGPEELEDSGEGPSQPSDSEDGDECNGGNVGEDSDDGDDGDDGDDNDDDLYSRPNRVPPAIPSSLVESIIQTGQDRSIPRHIREHNALEADEDATAAAVADPTTSSDGALHGLGYDQLNNDFEYQCLEEAVRMLRAELLAPV
ncbi:hypothetical protein HOY82DRAFT_603468 [Tuber indicum]|nr:hypothetical protein HOY82DRAFT_603468 [Tuber indicum]